MPLTICHCPLPNGNAALTANSHSSWIVIVPADVVKVITLWAVVKFSFGLKFITQVPEISSAPVVLKVPNAGLVEKSITSVMITGIGFAELNPLEISVAFFSADSEEEGVTSASFFLQAAKIVNNITAGSSDDFNCVFIIKCFEVNCKIFCNTNIALAPNKYNTFFE